MIKVQRNRLAARTTFFLVFLLAPVLDIFRFDLTQGHAILFGNAWTIGIDAFTAGHISAAQLGLNVLIRVFLPIAALAALVIGVSYRWGRVYCGWLCPHFSVVEIINSLMQRTIGKHSVWDKARLPEHRPDGRTVRADRRNWPLTLGTAFGFALLWAVALLTYLLPPAEIYSNLWHLSLTPNQARFIAVATLLLFIEFTLARHLFCRFGCALGLFQSLAWMANRRSLVVGFDHSRARSCSDCDNACDNACPMRLHPRSFKRNMFTCTQCAQCIQACEHVQADTAQGSLLQWVDGACALDKSARGLGHRPSVPHDCFTRNRPSATGGTEPAALPLSAAPIERTRPAADLRDSPQEERR